MVLSIIVVDWLIDAYIIKKKEGMILWGAIFHHMPLGKLSLAESRMENIQIRVLSPLKV